MPIPEQYLRKPSKEEINDLPISRYQGPVEVIRTQEELDLALPRLSRPGVLGFDTESRPAFCKGKYYPPSLVQLAAADTVFIIQLVWLPLSDTLAALLADPHILKVGAAINDDFKELRKKLEQELEKTKKYVGSKQTEYEYKHKFCKKII